MAQLPKDPYMLLSAVNMLLRDRYPDLDALCDDLDEDREELCRKLAQIGYFYDSEHNAFR